MTGAEPYFRSHVFVCTNRRAPDHPRGDCACRHSEPLAQYLKGRVKEEGLKRVRINTAGCLHRCSHGPVLVIYPEGVWYTFAGQADLDEILETHLKGRGRVTRLMLPDRSPESQGHAGH